MRRTAEEDCSKARTKLRVGNDAEGANMSRWFSQVIQELRVSGNSVRSGNGALMAGLPDRSQSIRQPAVRQVGTASAATESGTDRVKNWRTADSNEARNKFYRVCSMAKAALLSVPADGLKAIPSTGHTNQSFLRHEGS